MRCPALLLATVIALAGCGPGELPPPRVPIPAELGGLRVNLKITERPDRISMKGALPQALLDAGLRVTQSDSADVWIDVVHTSNEGPTVLKVISGGEVIAQASFRCDNAFNEFTWLSCMVPKLVNYLAQSRPVLALAERRGSPSPAPAPAAREGRSLASGSPQPTAYALIIGVERYREQMPVPAGARADAERFAEVARTTLGVPQRNIRLALDDRATKTDIEKHLDWLKANVPAGGRIYFYFGGHGAPEPAKGTSYLLPYDGDPAFVERTGVPLAGVLKALSRTRAKEVLAFVDSCFSGAGGRSVLPAGARPLVVVKTPATVANVALLSASSGSEISRGRCPAGAAASSATTSPRGSATPRRTSTETGRSRSTSATRTSSPASRARRSGRTGRRRRRSSRGRAWGQRST
jgi:hypothetical protein